MAKCWISGNIIGFLTLLDREVLADAGKVSAEMARIHAETEWEKYRIVQDRLYQSDFDRFLLLEEESAQISHTRPDKDTN